MKRLAVFCIFFVCGIWLATAQHASIKGVITSMDSTVFSSQLKKTLASNASNVIYSNTANDSVTFGFGSGATTVSVIADIKLAGVSQGVIDYPNTDATLLREIKVVKNSDVAEMKVDGVYVGMVDSLPNINSAETVAYDMDGKVLTQKPLESSNPVSVIFSENQNSYTLYLGHNNIIEKVK